MCPPTNKQELQSYLGSINFMSSFVENLTQKTHIMRGLLKKNVTYTWTSDMQEEFERAQQAIADATQLTHFDPKMPVVIETDASLKGLGAVLKQNGRPIRFLSKSLTPAESNYSNIERELLAVLFACEKLHNHIFGREVTVKTDHKPLESIFQKPVSLAPPRLQRMLLRLVMYDVKVKYVSASGVPMADTLSRLIPAGRDKPIPGLDVTIAQVVKIRQTRLATLQDETRNDPVLRQLSELIMRGWPESMQDVNEALQPYWCFRDELAVHDGLIVNGSRVVIPTSLRHENLQKLHDGHQGLSSTLQRARKTLYWPNIKNDIDMIKKCEKCQIHAKKNPKVPQRQISEIKPMEIVAAFIMDFKGKPVLVQIDYYSGYTMADQLCSQTQRKLSKIRFSRTPGH